MTRLHRRGRSFWPALCAALLVLATFAAYAADEVAPPAEVLAPGEPALTREGVGRFTNFLEWMIDVPFTPAQRDLLQQGLVESWTNKDQDEIDTYTQTLELEAQVTAMEPGRREVVRQQIQPELLKELRGKPENEAAAWLLAIYTAGHRPIAKGQPPLTRKITDSFVDLLCFMLSEAMTQKIEAPAQLHDAMAKFLAEGYPKLSAEEQAQFARMPLIWAAFQAAWPDLTDEEKAPYREQFTAMFKPYLDKLKQAAAAAAAEAEAQAQARAKAQSQTQAAAQPQSGSKGRTNTPQQAYMIMAAQQHSWQIMQNVLQSQANTGRIMAANLGNSYTYQYHY